MGDAVIKPETKLSADRQYMCDKDILRLLADQNGRSLLGIASHFHVTQTAIRERLLRLTAVQSVVRRRDDEPRRGRPRYLYYITSRGTAALAETSDDGTD